MGMFQASVKVSNLKKAGLSFEREFWVDSGALYTFIPEDFPKKISVEPVDTRDLILADGRRDKRLLGFCNLEVKGLKGAIPCPVVFAPRDSLFLLGATALENFGVAVDPAGKKLMPIASVIGGFLGSA